MSEEIGCIQFCHDGMDASSPECKNRLLMEENARLREQVQDAARAHARVEELMTRLNETDAALRAEVERGCRLKEQLHRACGEAGTGSSDRIVDLMAANERLIQDSRERAQIELALREKERRLQDVLDSMLAGVLIIDRETHHIVDVNPAAVAAIGLPKDRIIGRTCHQFVCPAQKGSCPITDLGQTVDRSERVLLRSDGVYAPILKSVAPLTWQGREYLVESFVDISKLTQAEADANESLSLLEAALEATADGLLVVDGLGRIKEFNKQFQDLWKLPGAVLDTCDDDLALAEATPRLRNPEAFIKKVRELYAHRERDGHDIVEFKDGRVVEYYSKPQRMGDQIVGRVWSFRDITEKHTAERKRAALLHRVAEINEELTHFAYIVSHDLKAPLRGIKLITEWLCTDYADKLGDDAKEQLDLLQSRVARMHNLIDGVLQYSRVGRITEETEKVDLNPLLAGILDAIVPPEHIRVTVAPQLPVLQCERTRISQVFQNLLTNAVKFVDKPQGEIRVDCIEDGEFWRFSVADNGPGIEAKYFDRIFRLFQTLSPRDEFESTGVGLALVKKIVEMYGGRIWVTSEVGRGTTFLFTFPRSCQVAGQGSSVPESVCLSGYTAGGMQSNN